MKTGRRDACPFAAPECLEKNRYEQKITGNRGSLTLPDQIFLKLYGVHLAVGKAGEGIVDDEPVRNLEFGDPGL